MEYGFNSLLLFPLTGIIFVLLGIPLKRDKIPPNMWYGFRTPKTLSNEKTWYEVNRIAGQDMITAGLAIVVISIPTILFHDRIGSMWSHIILTAVTLVMIIRMAINGFSILRKF